MALEMWRVSRTKSDMVRRTHVVDGSGRRMANWNASGRDARPESGQEHAIVVAPPSRPNSPGGTGTGTDEHSRRGGIRPQLRRKASGSSSCSEIFSESFIHSFTWVCFIRGKTRDSYGKYGHYTLYRH